MTDLIKVEFRVDTDAPGYKVRLDDEYIQFDEQGIGTVEKPEGWDCMVYYELLDSSIGQYFEMHIDQKEQPVRIDVTTDKAVFGFTGFIVQK